MILKMDSISIPLVGFYYRQGKGKEAVDYIKRAIRAMNSDDAILRDHLGDAYLLTGDKETRSLRMEACHSIGSITQINSRKN